MSINNIAPTDDRASFNVREQQQYKREEEEEDIFDDRARERPTAERAQERAAPQEDLARKVVPHALHGSAGYVAAGLKREDEPAAGASPTDDSEIASANAASAQDSSLSGGGNSSRLTKTTSLDRSGGSVRNAALSRTSSGNKTPSTPSPGKMQSVAKAERKQKRIFFLQSMQRRKAEGEDSSSSSSVVPSSSSSLLAQSNAAKFLDVKGVRAGGIGYSLTDHQGVVGEPPVKRSNARSIPLGGVPPLPVEAAQRAEMGFYSGDDQELEALKQARLASGGQDVSGLFSQFQSSSFSARESASSSSAYLEPNNQLLKPVVSRQLNTAPVVVQKRSRFPTLRGGKLGQL
jgi:hypothetical protein